MLTIKCDNCGKDFLTYPCYLKRKRKNHFCCKECEAEFKKYNNTVDSWKGGHVSKSNGYKYIRINGKDVEEHRLIMMRHLGRPLKTDEQVHHINGDKLDNRIENLIVLTNAEHQKLHGKSRENVCVCSVCKKRKKHHARGLCDTCYHTALVKGELKNYATKQIS